MPSEFFCNIFSRTLRTKIKTLTLSSMNESSKREISYISFTLSPKTVPYSHVVTGYSK